MTGVYFIYLELLGVAFMVSLCSLPVWRRVCWGAGLLDAPGNRKIHSAPMPLAGGLALLTGIVTAIGWLVLAEGWAWRSQAAAGNHIWCVSGGALSILVLGLFDDRFELNAAVKFAGQLLIVSSVCFLGLRLRLFPPGLDQVASVLWILAVTNAFNFMDNMNGLSAGLACVGSLAMAVVLEMSGYFLEAAVCFAMAGAIIGFLPYNYPRASAFLGDSGSHFLGFVMATISLNGVMFGPSLSRSALAILVVAVPLLDMVQVVAWRCWHRRPVWIADRNHLSHRLVSWGLSPAVAVVVLWTLALLASLAGVILWIRD